MSSTTFTPTRAPSQRSPGEAASSALAAAWATTDTLLDLVRAAAMDERPIPERHRLIFYLGHLEAFDWNLLGRDALGLDPADETLDRLFAFGIDPPPGELPSDPPDAWPPLAEVRQYCRRVREAVGRIVGNIDDNRFQVALEHRLMHAETLSYLLHQLPLDAKDLKKATQRPKSAWAGSRPASVDLSAPPRSEMVQVPEGEATLGRSEGFGWDNEFEAHRQLVPAFRVGRYKVTNAEYLDFVETGGGAVPPFWRHTDKGWKLRVMFGEVPLPPDWPVYVTQRQAAAYARAKGLRLPTEAEFHRAAYGVPVRHAAHAHPEREYPWGNEPPTPARGNFDLQSWDPVPVHATPDGDSAWGVAQLVGNGWEWTSTIFGPFPGFRAFSFYPGYSANFFDGQHYVLKGGSPVTAARLLRRSFRNWFRPEYPYLYAGFRCVGE
jgi:iron(II)-dependent oxidoreductase